MGAERTVERVLRLCSVFELPAERLEGADVRFDPVGGMQSHTGALTRQLDARGVHQRVVTSRLSGPGGRERLGAQATVVRVGLAIVRARQAWAGFAVAPAAADRGTYDVVHAHQGEDLAALPLGLAMARWHGCPLVLTLHCSMAHTYVPVSRSDRVRQVLGAAIERRVTRMADAVLCLTPRGAVRLVEDGVDRARVVVVPSGVDVTRYGPDSGPDPLPSVGRPRVVYVGRLAEQKSVGTLVEAVALLPHETALAVVGDGPQRASLEALAVRLGIADRVHFTGFVAREVVPAVLSHADVLVLPSLYEELGSVLLEGLATGVPIVASDVGGIPEVIEDGRTGLLVPPGDPAALARRIRQVLDDPGVAGRLAAGARGAADRYSWDRLADEVLGVYESVAREAGGPHRRRR